MEYINISDKVKELANLTHEEYMNRLEAASKKADEEEEEEE